MPAFNIRHFLIRASSFVSKPRLVVQERPVDLNESTACENPIIVFGIHRSGTTLFQRILNSHKNIACPPESLFFRFFVEMEKDASFHAGMEAFGYLTEGDRRAQLFAWMTKHHELYRLSQKKGRWADKTADYIKIMDGIMNIAPKQTQPILVFRHPYDIAYSINERGWWGLDQVQEDPFGSVVSFVKRYFKDLIRAEQQYSAISLRYEDLVSNPVEVLQGVFASLGEEWDENVLNFNKHHHNLGWGDPVVQGASSFFQNSGNWKYLSRNQIGVLDEQLGPLLHHKGYSAVDPIVA